MAGALQLPIERRRDLGNWKDTLADDKGRVSEPMVVRYSSQRLEATASVKRLCLGAVLHLLKWASARSTKPSMAQLEGCIRSLPNIERHTRHHTWGTMDAKESDADTQEEIPLFHEVYSSASEETSTSASSLPTSAAGGTHDADPDPLQRAAEMKVMWIAPHKSQLLHAARPTALASRHAETTPLCRDAPFISGYDEGQGVAAAPSLRRDWCPRCLRRLDSLSVGVYLASVCAAAEQTLDGADELKVTEGVPAAAAPDLDCTDALKVVS